MVAWIGSFVLNFIKYDSIIFKKLLLKSKWNSSFFDKNLKNFNILRTKNINYSDFSYNSTDFKNTAGFLQVFIY